MDKMDEMVEVGDGVMVGGGEVGIEVGEEGIGGIEGMLIKKCMLGKKGVMVGREMLERMMKNGGGSGGEVSDMGNGI